MGVTFCQEDPDAPIPQFNTLDEWNDMKSTKIDLAAKIVGHLLSRDDAPEVQFVDGEAIFPQMPPTDPTNPPTRERKVAIYQEFSSYRPIMQNVRLFQPILSIVSKPILTRS